MSKLGAALMMTLQPTGNINKNETGEVIVSKDKSHGDMEASTIEEPQDAVMGAVDMDGGVALEVAPCEIESMNES